MGLGIHKEVFNQGINFSARPQLLPTGMLHYAENIRPQEGGGWVARMGTRLVNGAPYGATDEDRVVMGDEEVLFGTEEIVYMGSGAESHDKDFQFIEEFSSADVDSELILLGVGGHMYSLDGLSSYQSKTYIGACGDAAKHTTAVVEGRFYNCPYGSYPRVYGGTEEYPIALMVFDGSEFKYEVHDLDRLYGKLVSRWTLATYGGISLDSFPTADYLYIGCNEPTETINIDIGSANGNAAVLTVETFGNSSWSSVLDTDGTSSGGASFAIDGAITLDLSGVTPRPFILNGVDAYWFRLSWDAALDSSVSLRSITIEPGIRRQTTKWDSIYHQVITAYEYNTSSGEVTDVTGEISNDAREQFVDLGNSSNNELWIKTSYPMATLGIAVDPDYPNTAAWPLANFLVNSTNYGDEETQGTNGADLEQSGTCFIHLTSWGSTKKTKFEDRTAGYWYKLELSGTPSAEVRIYQVVWGALPFAFSSCRGIVEFQKRLVIWGTELFPNRLVYSLGGRPDMIVPTNTMVSNPIGDDTYIERCINFKNWLLVFKDSGEVVLVDAEFNSTRISRTVGLHAFNSVQVVEIGDPNMRRDEIVTIALWLSQDGVYKFDGTSIFKISQSLDKYFDPNSSDYLGSSLSSAAGFFDPVHEEYHLCVGTSYELVYNVRVGAWTGVFLRATNQINCSLVPKFFATSTSQAPVLLGTNYGQVLVLDETATDIDYDGYAHGVDIEFYSRFIGAQSQSGMLAEIFFRGLTFEVGDCDGTYTLNIYTDGDITTPAITENSFDLAAPAANTEIFEVAYDSSKRCRTFMIRLTGDDVAGAFEILSVMFRSQGLFEPKK